MAARNSSRLAQYDAALIFVPFSIKSTKSTALRSHNTLAITLPADLTILDFFPIARTREVSTPCLHVYLRGVMVNPRLVSSDNAFEETMTMNGILLEVWEITSHSLRHLVFGQCSRNPLRTDLVEA